MIDYEYLCPISPAFTRPPDFAATFKLCSGSSSARVMRVSSSVVLRPAPRRLDIETAARRGLDGLWRDFRRDATRAALKSCLRRITCDIRGSLNSGIRILRTLSVAIRRGKIVRSSRGGRFERLRGNEKPKENEGERRES